MIMPAMGKLAMKAYGKIARKAEGSNTDQHLWTGLLWIPIKAFLCWQRRLTKSTCISFYA